MTVVLDASAVLALIQGEAGAERVRAVIRNAARRAVNLTEVVIKLIGKGIPEDEVRVVLDEIELPVHPHDADLAIDAGSMDAATRQLGCRSAIAPVSPWRGGSALPC